MTSEKNRQAVVIDASVALKWVVNEEGSDAAAALLDGRPLFAPSLILTEAANALWSLQRRQVIDPSGAADALDHLRAAPWFLSPSDADLIGQAFRLAQLLDHPVYDCVYLALAVEKKVPVITADRRFLNVARKDADTEMFVQALDVGKAPTQN